MKIFYILVFVLIPLFSYAQLRQFEITPMAVPNTPVVQANANYPDNALILVYSSLENLSFRSSMNAINQQRYNAVAGRYEILVNPIKQLFFVSSKGFMESSIATLNPSPKDIYYFKIEEYVDEQTIGKANLNITSFPSDAKISINDIKTVYSTPYKSEVNSGLTRIVLEKENYQRYDTLFRFSAKQNINLAVNMIPDWADITVNVNQPNAQIFIDGENMGKGKIQIIGSSGALRPGKHYLQVQLEKYQEFNQEIMLVPGQMHSYDIILEEVTGKLNVATSPLAMDIYLNDQFIGKSPFTKDIQIGEYSMRVGSKGFKPVYRSFTLNKEETKEYSFEMVDFNKQLVPLKITSFSAMGIGILGIGSGFYFKNLADDNYSKYLTATIEAESLRKKVESNDKMSRFGFLAGGIGLVAGTVITIKTSKSKKNWGISMIPINDGLIMSYTTTLH